MLKPTKDPKGGLTAAGRRHYKRTEGANLKPGVKGKPKGPADEKRKGSFLARMFGGNNGPLTKPNGEPTRKALSAQAWGEPVPKTDAAAKRLAAKGRHLLEKAKRHDGKA